jgi:hypothetical protein
MAKHFSPLILLLTCFGSTLLSAQEKIPAEMIDYHQHLYSPEAGARSSPGPKGIDGSDLIAQLDAAGIRRAVVLSVAYSFSNPNKPSVPHEYAHVVAENNWTGDSCVVSALGKRATRRRGFPVFECVTNRGVGAPFSRTNGQGR